VSRKTEEPDCSVCKNINEELFILWAVGNQYPASPNEINRHRKGSNWKITEKIYFLPIKGLMGVKGW
jgi:hypothetical protein